jgi:GAF domain-containing protein
MAEDLIIDKELSKEQRYDLLYPQLKALVDGEPDQLANYANFCAAIKETFDFLWIGFYRVIGDELVLGNFQGPVACTRIKKGRGVCGKAWEGKKTIIVEDVDQFEDHIACSSASKSEIVIPILNDNDEVIAVLDIDHSETNAFDEIDRKKLSELLALIS